MAKRTKSKRKSAGLTYRSSGVDVSANDRMVAKIKHALRRTYDPRVLSQHGAFAGLMRLDFAENLLQRHFKEPVLVAGADGVGSKLLLGIEHGKIGQLGVDLVAMSVNDILTLGAEPLFFLDYVACHHLDPEHIAEIVTGVSDGCVEAGCALLGGETAEMPAMYAPTHFDLAGFCVGVVDRHRIVDGRDVQPGDAIIGIASSGIHSNGYSLVRAALKKIKSQKRAEEALGEPLADAVLRPTRIYVRPILKLLKHYKRKRVVRAMAHITGGGLEGNLPRVLPDGCAAEIRRRSWSQPPIFDVIHQAGVDIEEMYDVFNMGVGFVLVVRPTFADSVIRQLEQLGETAWRIGVVRRGKRRLIWKK